MPEDKKASIKVLRGVVHINNEPVKSHLPPPTPMELFHAEDQSDIDKIKVHISDEHSQKSSKFIAYSVNTQNLNEFRMAYRKVCQLTPSAAHVTAACVIPGLDEF